MTKIIIDKVLALWKRFTKDLKTSMQEKTHI